jgi:hypothetical protein
VALGGEAKRYIDMEIKRQMEPTLTLLQELKKQGSETHEWLLGFWANGSGRPEGLFQRRMKDDDKWRAQMEEHKETVTQLVSDLCKAREFREKREAEEKERQEEEKRLKAERKKFWISVFWRVGLPAILGIFGLIGTGIVRAAPVVKILIDDYLQAHPRVSEQLKNKAQNESNQAHNGEQESSAPLY